ncbi:MAG: gamma-glutamyltransferase [Armatimonadota bacterium]|nr:gamma-glutamyltransferase [Armatimonadota bacterium]
MDSAQIGWKASGTDGAVAAGGAEAVAASIEVLADGGNAADAAVATLLALAVTDYGSFAIGGEIPFIIHEAESRRTTVLGGVGGAPLDHSAIDWYYASGIPDEGGYRAMPVPGALHLCLTALAMYGTRSFEAVVAPTLRLLDAGDSDSHSKLARTLRRMVQAERQTSGTRDQRLCAARDRFYVGDIADDLVAWYEETGSFLRKRDLAAHVTTVEEPVSVGYRGYVVHKCNTWTQGPVLCQALRLLEGHDLRAMGHVSADYIHVLTEAIKLAYADRDAWYGDPALVGVPLARLLSGEYTRIRRPLMDMEVASRERRPGDPLRMEPLLGPCEASANDVATPISDTTTCVVADRWGNVVAATPSCNLVGNEPDPRTGVTGGNRLRSMNTTPGHPNRIQPGKRPRVTLTPTLVSRNGRPVAAISVAGGDLQDQTSLNLLLDHIEFGMLPDEAVTRPRLSTDHMENSFDSDPDRDRAFKAPGSLQVNTEVPHDTRRELARRGHELTITSDAIAAPVMLCIDDGGQVHAAGDPKAGRHAAAVDDAG